MQNWKSLSDRTWSQNSIDVDPIIPDLSKEKIPKFDRLMERDAPTPSLWDPSKPPIVPTPTGPDPFGPIPVLPNRGPPIDVDPPSRPPQWMFGPPEIAERMPSLPRFPLEALFAVDPGRALSEWASSSSRRSSIPPAPPSIAAAMLHGSTADLLMDYIRRQKQQNARQAPGVGRP